MPYPEIHIWDFPPTRTYLRVNDYRIELLKEFVQRVGTHEKAGKFLSQQSGKYGKSKSYGSGAIIPWIRGKNYTTGGGRYIPLSVAIDISKFLTNSDKIDNPILRIIEENIEFIVSRGNSTKVHTRFPLYATPELTSVVFHLCGDGFLADKAGKTSTYRQVNKTGLMNFVKKLHNSFGLFSVDETALRDFKVLIPRVITDFYRHYFSLDNLRWDVARIPEKVKDLPKEYLIAGLTSFILDEGNVSDHVEVYSSNPNLLGDIHDIAKRVGYLTGEPKQKSKNSPKEFRVYFSNKSIQNFSKDIADLSKVFPTCDLSHKQPMFDEIIATKTRGFQKKPVGETRDEILRMITEGPLKTYDISSKLKINQSTIRVHLAKLEKEKMVNRTITIGQHAHQWKKSTSLF